MIVPGFVPGGCTATDNQFTFAGVSTVAVAVMLLDRGLFVVRVCGGGIEPFVLVNMSMDGLTVIAFAATAIPLGDARGGVFRSWAEPPS